MPMAIPLLEHYEAEQQEDLTDLRRHIEPVRDIRVPLECIRVYPVFQRTGQTAREAGREVAAEASASEPSCIGVGALGQEG